MKQEDSPADAAPPSAPGAAASANPDSHYLAVMVALLMSVTIFEGYDVTIFHLCTPDIARTFHLSDLDVGLMASLVRLGGMLAFFVVMAADRIGRKPIVAATVLCYTLFTLMTALSRGLGTFTAFQSCAQLFLSAEFAVAVIMISEEFPDRWRGRGVAILNVVGLVGVIAGAALYSPVAGSSLGWRGMYFIGIAPLMLVTVMRRRLRETVRFSAAIAVRPRLPLLAQTASSLRTALRALGGPYRGRLLLVALLWNSVGLVGAPAVTFFSLYARRDRHWSRAEIGSAIILAYAIGTLGHLAAGYLLDRIGRRLTTSAFYVAGAVAILLLFQTASHRAILVAMIATVFAFQGARTVTATYSTELFPTEVRATSYSLTVQVLGQLAALLTPFIIGALSRTMGGLGNAVAVMSIGPIIGAALVMLFAPETRGKTLEEAAA
jgi:MFS family permease